MSRCFVIQPFDAGKYDKRFQEVYSPAIVAAGLEPYRVDQDPGVNVPIESIEDGIRNSAVCLADITDDNPNVWYELGYAFATGRPVVMVCSEERTGNKYPFDIQHRTINRYKPDSIGDFEKLRTTITNRIKALLKSSKTLQTVRENESIAPLHGLSQPELVVLATAAGSVVLPYETISPHPLKSDVERAGFTSIAFTLGLKRLRDKEYVEIIGEEDFNGNQYQVLRITLKGWDWIERNESQFLMKRPKGEEEMPF